MCVRGRVFISCCVRGCNYYRDRDIQRHSNTDALALRAGCLSLRSTLHLAPGYQWDGPLWGDIRLWEFQMKTFERVSWEQPAQRWAGGSALCVTLSSGWSSASTPLPPPGLYLVHSRPFAATNHTCTNGGRNTRFYSTTPSFS